LLIYDHTNNKSNESVTVADSGYLKITEDKKFMVMNLYNGVNYVEEPPDSRRDQKTYPYRRNMFDEQTIRVKVKNFDFNRRDESIFKNTYRMLNISQLKLMEDTLNNEYYARLQSYIVQINLNSAINKKLYNLTVRHDSLKRNFTVIEPDTLIKFDEYIAGADSWVKAEIVSSAISSARNNMQNLNMFQGQLYENKKTINKYEMERHRKFTLSIAVVIFFFIGAPLGAIIRKGGMGMPVVVSILLFIAYYIVSMTGEKSAREDVWEMVGGMWFSSFIFLPIGVWLTFKAATDSAVMSADTYVKWFNKICLKRFSNKNSKTK